MNEKLRTLERTKRLVGAGLLALGLSGCVPPDLTTRAYYEPFTDNIVYNFDSENDPQTVTHENTHKKRANEYQYGRWAWGLRYTIDKNFACEEEKIANEAAGISPIDDHSVCDFTIEQ